MSALENPLSFSNSEREISVFPVRHTTVGADVVEPNKLPTARRLLLIGHYIAVGHWRSGGRIGRNPTSHLGNCARDV